MYLKRIELLGFKSFPRKQDIKLHPGITVFVGPNGCGKSNVIEAVRWALGEQSAKELRSTKMDDVIFDGSVKLKRFNTAEVSLTFSNEGELPLSFTEVMISRRITRTGKKDDNGRDIVAGSYMINRHDVRLRDVKDLLLSMGMASTNYMLFQKETIERIANNGSKEIRAIIEEGADIAKYKEKKEESLKRLNKTLENVRRLTDILNTLEAEVAELQQQAKEAAEKEKLENDLKETEKKLFSVKYKNIMKELEGIGTKREEIDEKRDEIEGLITEAINKIERHEEEYEEIKGNIKALNIDIEALNSEINNISEEINKIVGFLRGISDNEKLFNDNISKLEDEKYAEQLKIERIEREIEDLNKTAEEMKEKIKSLSEAPQIKEFEEKENRKRELLQDLQTNKTLLERLIFDAKNIENTLEHLKSERDNINALLNEKKDILSSLEEEKESKSEESNVYENKVEDIRDRIREINEEKQKTIKRTEDVRNKISQKESSVSSLQRKKDHIENLLKGKLPEDILSFTNKKKAFAVWEGVAIKKGYEKSFGILYALFSNLVLFKDKEVFTIKSGDVPLFSVKMNHKKTDKRNLSEGVEKVTDNVLQEFFASIVLVDDIKDAEDNEITVDMQGNISINGYIYGGMKDANIKNVSIGIEFEEIEKKLKEEEKELNELYASLDELTDIIRKLDTEQISLEEDLKEAKNSLVLIDSEINDMDRNINVLSAEIAKLEERYNAVNTQIIDAETKRGNWQKEISSLKKKIEFAEKELEEVSARLDEIASFEEKRKELYKIEADLKNTENMISLKKDELKSVSKNIKIKEKDIADYKTRLEEFHTNRMESLSKQNQLESVLEEKKNALNKLKEEYRVYTNKSEELEEELKKWREIKEKNTNIMSELIADRKALNVEGQNLREQMNEIASKSEELYAVTLEELPQAEESDTAERLENRLKRIRNKILRMGDVNMLAGKLFAEKQVKVDDYKKQIEDLLKAKEDIEETIKKVDSEAITRFMHYFAQVQEKFHEVFDRLLSGEGEIVLDDPKNPLDCEISLQVSPKGKRTKQLRSLSTGEKTLMILSLLFAVYLVRPAPLCIMDEVDAPLDDANVERFIQLIKELSTKSQFLIVTHNKRTMEAADYIFGVTMDEPSVTTIYSWSMKDVENKLKEEPQGA